MNDLNRESKVGLVHHLNVEDAINFGVNEALFLYNIRYWIRENQARKTNFFEGRYWTYNSSSAFAKIQPYFAADKIDRIIKKLESIGILLIGNFNRTKYDRTRWFSINEEWTQKDPQTMDEFIKQHGDIVVPNSNIAFRESTEWNMKKSEINSEKIQNQLLESAEPIPYIKPDLKKNKKHIHRDSDSDEPERKCFPSDFKKNKTKQINFDFEKLYNAYPRGQGKKNGIERCKRQIKTQEDYDRLAVAIENYSKINSTTEVRYIKHFDSFMSVWEDYVVLKDVQKFREKTWDELYDERQAEREQMEIERKRERELERQKSIDRQREENLRIQREFEEMEEMEKGNNF